MNIQDLYSYLIEAYGRRRHWISDIATELGITYEEANYLTYFLGYRRGKIENKVKTFEQFICDAGVKAIFVKIYRRKERCFE